MKARFTLIAAGLSLVLIVLLLRRSDSGPTKDSMVAGPSTIEPNPGAGPPSSSSRAVLPVTKATTRRSEPSRETKSLVGRRLARLAALQNPDGTWGDRLTLLGHHWIDETGLTALVIEAFLQCGYSHLSKDEMDGVQVGKAIKNGLFALMRRQAVDGSFSTSGDPTVNQSLAALALCEAYGMSASVPFKEPAQLAVNALQRRFSPASGWEDDATAAWAAFALGTARLSELTIDATVADRSMDFSAEGLPSGSSPLQALAWSFLRDGRHGNAELKLAADLARDRPIGDDLFSAFVDTALVYQQEGPSGEGWKARGREFAKTLPDMERPGEFTGTDSASMLRLILESFHLYLWYWRPPGVVPSKD